MINLKYETNKWLGKSGNIINAHWQGHVSHEEHTHSLRECGVCLFTSETEKVLKQVGIQNTHAEEYFYYFTIEQMESLLNDKMSSA